MTHKIGRLAPRIIALIALALGGFGSVQARSASPESTESDDWMALLVNGQKSGFLHSQRHVQGNSVESSQHMQWELKRSGIPIRIEITDSSRETRDGKPLSFRSEQKLSNITLVVEGTMIDDHTLKLTKSGMGPASTKTIAWQPDWLLSEGLRQQQLAAFRQQGMKPGSRHSATVFVPSLEKAVRTTTVLGDMQDVDLLGQTQRLRQVTETTDLGLMKQVSEAWVDDQFNVKKMRVQQMMGMQLEMIACPKACATAKSQPFEAFAETLAQVPRSLSDAERQKPLLWEFHLKQPLENIQPPQSEEQRAHIATGKDGTQVLRVRVTPNSALAQTSPNPGTSGNSLGSQHRAATKLKQWTQPTPWLQSDANLIVGLAKKTVRGNQSDAEKMQAITGFVRRYINDKSLSVAYASALETAKYRNGDCTEHALLTAAMGRALGIPTRIATGLVYVPELDGQRNVLVPHAWTQAFVNGAWKSYDAAIGQFDSGHIALDYGDGDPTNFYAGIQLIGNLEVHSVKPAK